MARGMQLNGRAVSLPRGLTIGAAWATGWTALNIMVVGMLISKEIIPFEMIGYTVVYIILSASFLCARMAHGRIKEKRIVVSIWAAVIYFVLLLSVNIMFFGGEYTAVGVTALCVCGGSALSLLGNKRQRRVRRGYIHKNTGRNVVQNAIG